MRLNIKRIGTDRELRDGYKENQDEDPTHRFYPVPKLKLTGHDGKNCVQRLQEKSQDGKSRR